LHTILLCGGSGQRLWPLSGRIRSKMFLKLLPAPDGGTESMIERVCRQLENSGLGPSSMFVAHQDQAALMRRYTRNGYEILGEPHKRGTFTAAALAALYLHSAGKAGPEDIICAAPADMYADDGFFQLFHQFREVLSASQAELALLGTRPTYPSDQYGYIIPGAEYNGVYSRVLSFEEKPGLSRAAELIEKQALWNCGVFAFRLGFMLRHLEQMALPTELSAFTGLYPDFPVRSFDKEVAERSSNAVVVRHEGEWRDLGSWDTLTAQLHQPVIGTGGIWGNSRNTHIVNELSLPLHVIGVSDIVAVGSPEGILIAAKQEANAIKEIIHTPSAKANYGETAWGHYTVLDQTSGDLGAVLTIKLTLLAGHELPEMSFPDTSKRWMILSGHGEVVLNGLAAAARSGDTYAVARGERHGIRACSAMELLEIRIGSLAEDSPVYSS
jgi:mannose-1-phosphate guanylyltransferase